MQPKVKVAYLKAQSAMEYLSTYGWSVLVLGIVTVSIFGFGVFNQGSYSPGTCVSQTGFLCATPILNGNGILNISLGQSSGITYNITGVSCINATGTNPTFTQLIPKIQVMSGQNVKINFLCGLSSNKVGTPFAGTLWVQYNTQSSTGLEAKIGTVDLKVSTSSGLGGQGLVLYEIPITLANTQTVASSTNMQQLLYFNASGYQPYESNTLNNIEFFWPNGTIVPSWMESNGNPTSTQVVYWLNIARKIPASGNVLIYLGFGSNTVNLFNKATIGEAPNITTPYGLYDNGGSVFLYYNNASNNNQLSNFVYPNSGGTAIVSSSNPYGVTSNILEVTGGPSNGISKAPILVNEPFPGNNIVMEAWTQTQSYGGFLFDSANTLPYPGTTNFYDAGHITSVCNQCFSWIYYANAVNFGAESGGAGSGVWYWLNLTISGNKYQLDTFSGVPEISGALIGNTLGTNSTGNIPVMAQQYLGFAQTGTSHLYYGFRVRNMPPNGVMPSVTFGTLITT